MFEQFGDGLEATIALSVVGEGVPLIYNGQEAGNEHRLAFFEKDEIQWHKHSLGELYKKLFALKKAQPALWNGAWGARMILVVNNMPQQVLSFVRQNKQSKVFAIFNFSDKAKTLRFEDTLCHDEYKDFFDDQSVFIGTGYELHLPAWGYKLFVK